MELKKFAQAEILLTEEYLEVENIANELLEILNQADILEKIHFANQPGNKSQIVQEAFQEEAIKLGFTSEKEGLFSDYQVRAIRPDYFKKNANVRYSF